MKTIKELEKQIRDVKIEIENREEAIYDLIRKIIDEKDSVYKLRKIESEAKREIATLKNQNYKKYIVSMMANGCLYIDTKDFDTLEECYDYISATNETNKITDAGIYLNPLFLKKENNDNEDYT